MIARLLAFFWGMREFRLDLTRHYDGDLIESYDTGREWAHRLTFRHYDDDEYQDMPLRRKLLLRGLPR